MNGAQHWARLVKTEMSWRLWTVLAEHYQLHIHSHLSACGSDFSLTSRTSHTR